MSSPVVSRKPLVAILAGGAAVVSAGLLWLRTPARDQPSATPSTVVESNTKSAPQFEPLKSAPAFELRDAFGNTHRFVDLMKNKKLMLVVFMGCECPIIQFYSERLQKFSDDWADRGLVVVGINSNAQDSLEEIQHWTKAAKIQFPILKDARGEVADKFQASRTPEAYLVDASGKVLYQGRIDDQYDVGSRRPASANAYARNAIEAALAGKPVATAYTQAVGCLIGRAPKVQPHGAATYSGAVSRLLHQRCIECHRDGEVAPFPLLSYEDVVGWAPMIKEVVSNGRMPPWGADPHIGNFTNSPLLTEKEKSDLFAWIDNGCPEGNRAELSPPPDFPTGWRMSKPDEVFYISDKPVKVEATGPIPYKTFIVPMNNTEEKWIKAAEIRPGNRRVVHHASFWILSPDMEEDNYNTPPNFPFTPGTPPLKLPEGCAIRVPAGSRVRMQMHYEPIGVETEDRTHIGFKYVSPSEVKGQVVYDSVFPTQPLSIAAGDRRSTRQGRHYFARDATLLALLPHMHVRGKTFRYTLRRPDGSKETILDVPRYEFDWQILYSFAKPLQIPAGSEMLCEAVFDNSPENPNNPDGSVRVQWGPLTFDEMLVGFMIGMDPTCNQHNASKFRFPQESFGAPLDRKWKLDVHGRSAKLTESDNVEGTLKVQIEPGSKGPAWGVQLTRNTIPVKKGMSYWVSLRAKASTPRKAVVGVNRSKAPFTSVGLYKEFDVNTQWQPRQFPLTASEDESNPVLRFDLGQSDGDVEIRDVVFLQGANRF